MNKKTIVWLVVAAFLVVIGCMIFGGVMSMLKWNFAKLSTVKYETNTYEIDEVYESIRIVADTADIVFVPSNDSKTEIVCYEQKNAKHSVTVKDGVLALEVADTRKWYEYIGINFGSPKITVYLPCGEHGELFIKGSTGDIEIPKELVFEEIDISTSTGDAALFASADKDIDIKTSTGAIRVVGVSANDIELSVSTGNITAESVVCEGELEVKVSTGRTKLDGVKCEKFTSKGSTGDVSLVDVIVQEKLSIERSTGDISFEACDAAELFVKTSTGDVKGSLLTEKIFIARSDTGRVNVPDSTVGGRCEITTDTGNIKIEIK